MYVNSNSTPSTGATVPQTPIVPVGGTGRVTTVTDGTTAYLLCRTVRGRGGWGVHTATGDLLSSGWPTLARARAYVIRSLTDTGGTQ